MLFLFSICTGFLIFLDKIQYKSIITPFNVLAIVYLVLINLNNLFIHNLFDFYLVTDRTMIILFSFLLLIFGVSSLTRLFFKVKKKDFDKSDYVNLIEKKRGIILLFFYVGLISRYVALIQTISRYGIENIKGNAFGIFAHIGSLSIILLPAVLIIFINNKQKIYHFIGIMLVFINMFIYGGKYILLINLSYVLFTYFFIYGLKRSTVFKLLLFLLLFTIIVFFFTYVVRPMLDLGYFDEDFFKYNISFATEHFFYYLLSPVIAMNDFFFMNINYTDGLLVVFTVPVNIVKAIFRMGNYVSPILTFTVPISYKYGTNVAGIFAETVRNIGFISTYLYIFILFLIIYIFYMFTLKKNKYVFMTSYLLATTIFLFFGNFFTVSGIILNLIYIFCFEFLLNKKVIFKE